MKTISFIFATFVLLSSYCKADEMPEVTIAEYGEFLLYSTLYIADKEGLFEKQGIRVKIVPAGGDEKVFASLLTGGAQFGIGDPTFVAISGEKGRPGKIIYSLLQNAPAFGIATNPLIKPNSKPSDLKGYTIATYPPPSTAYSLQKKIVKLGAIEPKIVPITYGGLISALIANRVDIALEYEPNVSLALEKGAHIVYSVSDYFPEIALTGVSVLPEYLDKNPEIAQKVINALQIASVQLFTNTNRAIEILKQRFPEYSENIIRNAILNCIKTNSFSRDGIVTKEGWRQAISLRQELGDLKADAPYDQYVVNSFALATNHSK